MDTLSGKRFGKRELIIASLLSALAGGAAGYVVANEAVSRQGRDLALVATAIVGRLDSIKESVEEISQRKTPDDGKTSELAHVKINEELGEIRKTLTQKTLNGCKLVSPFFGHRLNGLPLEFEIRC